MSWPMAHSRSTATAIASASRQIRKSQRTATASAASDYLISSLSKPNETSKTVSSAVVKHYSTSKILHLPLPSSPSRLAPTMAEAPQDVEPNADNDNNTEQDTTTKTPKQSLQQYKTKIISQSLQHVHEKGWTEDAIASATLSLNLPPTLMGLIPDRPYDLISYFMKQCNDALLVDIEQNLKPGWRKEDLSVAAKLEELLKVRLSYIIPFVRSKRWAEAMAVGVSTPDHAMTTASLLDEMATIVLNAALEGEGGASSVLGGMVEKAALTTVYASTELHLLADESVNYEDTWRFLKERISELERVAVVTSHGSSSSSGGVGGMNANMNTSDAMVAASAVASSLGGAVLSLAAPAASAAASTVAPSLMSFVQNVQPLNSQQGGGSGNGNVGTQPSDYYDGDEEKKEDVDKILDGLPSLEEEDTKSK